MPRFTATLHPRDKNGKFRNALNNHRKKKIRRLTKKNNRLVKQYSRDKSLHGTPFGDHIESNIIRRAVKVQALQGKVVSR